MLQNLTTDNFILTNINLEFDLLTISTFMPCDNINQYLKVFYGDQDYKILNKFYEDAKKINSDFLNIEIIIKLHYIQNKHIENFNVKYVKFRNGFSIQVSDELTQFIKKSLSEYNISELVCGKHNFIFNIAHMIANNPECADLILDEFEKIKSEKEKLLQNKDK